MPIADSPRSHTNVPSERRVSLSKLQLTALSALLPTFHNYNKVILIAGGTGASPASHSLHRHRTAPAPQARRQHPSSSSSRPYGIKVKSHWTSKYRLRIKYSQHPRAKLECMIWIRLPRHSPITTNINILILYHFPSCQSNRAKPQRIAACVAGR
jgi:hypothetical protein